MLATLGAHTVESVTGFTWQEVEEVELIDGSSYLGAFFHEHFDMDRGFGYWVHFISKGCRTRSKNTGCPFNPVNMAADPEKKTSPPISSDQACLSCYGVVFLCFAVRKAPLNNGVTHPLQTWILDTFGFIS